MLQVFFSELVNLCDADDTALLKLPCYKSVSNLVPLRKSALKALAACHYIIPMREKVFNVLYKSLNSSNQELQVASFQCMKMFISGFQIDMDMVRSCFHGLQQMQSRNRICCETCHCLVSITHRSIRQ